VNHSTVSGPLTEKEEVAYMVAEMKAEWQSKRHLHDKHCLEKDSEWPTQRPGLGTCGKHLFPGEEVALFTRNGHASDISPSVHVLCLACAPDYPNSKNDPIIPRGVMRRIGGDNWFTVTLKRCGICGYM